MGVKTLMTTEQLLELGDTRRTELVRGELIEMSPVNRTHARLVTRLLRWVDQYATDKKMGEVGTEWGFILARDPDIVRGPDVAFVAAARLIGAGSEGFFAGAPDLAGEVLSPTDRASEVQAKTREYLAAGARLVWVIDPQTQTVTVHRPSGDAHVYAGDDQVTGEDVLPGFSFRCAELFASISAPAA
jgi:Uma2 family endonuclease